MAGQEPGLSGRCSPCYLGVRGSPNSYPTAPSQSLHWPDSWQPEKGAHAVPPTKVNIGLQTSTRPPGWRAEQMEHS